MIVDRITGRELNKRWSVNAKHALYREDGKWYHHLTEFPGALFDKNGYVVFNTLDEYLNCEYLRHGKELHVTGGVSLLPGYIKVTG